MSQAAGGGPGPTVVGVDPLTGSAAPSDGSRGDLRRALRRQVVQVTAVYAVVAGLWIALSDRALGALVHDRNLLMRLSVYKGFAFVAATTVLLFLLLRRRTRQIERTLDALAQTEQERVAQEQERARAQSLADGLLEAMPGIFYLYDERGRFLRWNDDFLEVSGYEVDEILRMHPLDFFEGEERDLLQQRIAEVFEKGESSVEASFRSKDGSLKPYFFTGKRVVFDGKRCLIGVGLDITKRKEAEEALRELNESLERIVAERTADLERARQRAEEADRTKSAFLATMSHELRTPLNSIIGFTSLILQGLTGPVNEEQEKQLGMVLGSARHLLDLINDVLDISKIEAGQMEVRIAPFDPREAIERVCTSIRPLVDKRGLTLEVSVPEVLPEMHGDRRRFEQILINLLNNAVKFTDRGFVRLSAEIVEGYRRGEGDAGVRALRVRVADTGIGIREEDLLKLFQPFRQVDSGLQRQHEGTGLGLAISRRLAELLGGTIEAESVWTEGSTFTLTLPWNGTGR